MHWIIAAIITPIPLIHLWLHALLPWWRKYPWLFYAWGLGIFVASFFWFPVVANISPLLFTPSPVLLRLGIGLMLLGLGGILSSVWTLGIKRFFGWVVLRPASVSPQRVVGGPFRIVPHPAYFGYLLIAVGNFLVSGELYLVPTLIVLIFMTPIVIWLEEQELKERTGM